MPQKDYTKRKPRHPFNIHIWNKLIEKLSNTDSKRGYFNASKAYTLVLDSLEKYPIPILLEEQALQLIGVGPKMATMMMSSNKKHFPSCVIKGSKRSQLKSKNKKESQIQKGKSKSRKKTKTKETTDFIDCF